MPDALAPCILDVLNANRDTDQVGSDTASYLVLIRKLLMGGAGRVNNQAASIANIGKM